MNLVVNHPSNLSSAIVEQTYYDYNKYINDALRLINIINETDSFDDFEKLVKKYNTCLDKIKLTRTEALLPIMDVYLGLSLDGESSLSSKDLLKRFEMNHAIQLREIETFSKELRSLKFMPSAQLNIEYVR